MDKQTALWFVEAIAERDRIRSDETRPDWWEGDDIAHAIVDELYLYIDKEAELSGWYKEFERVYDEAYHKKEV